MRPSLITEYAMILLRTTGAKEVRNRSEEVGREGSSDGRARSDERREGLALEIGRQRRRGTLGKKREGRGERRHPDFDFPLGGDQPDRRKGGKKPGQQHSNICLPQVPQGCKSKSNQGLGNKEVANFHPKAYNE